jgi:predicted ATPase
MRPITPSTTKRDRSGIAKLPLSSRLSVPSAPPQMLRRLEIENFRSIRHSAIDFSSSGLTVVVGANGSGKSNLIKSLEFISGIARSGLENALTARRGIEGIVPKAIAKKDVERSRLRLAYDLELPPLQNYPRSFPALRVKHKLEIEYHLSEFPTLIAEVIEFSHPLLVQLFLGSEPRGGDYNLDEVPQSWRESWIRITRTNSGEIRLEAEPLVDAGNVAAYLRWFNLGALEEHFKAGRASTLFQVLALILATPSPKLRPTSETADQEPPPSTIVSLLDRAGGSPMLVAPEVEATRTALASIRRYDLQLIELRKEQIPNLRSMLTREGRGMPSAVRKLKEGTAMTGAWERIVATMSVIAPHVIDANVRSMPTEREFLEFIESRLGRPVESWEASDGTLRALATLVALETHPPNGIILVEEPEQGLHPWAIRALLEHMREAVRSRGLQVILTTHSAQVLECIAPEELLVATRNVEMGTTFVGIKDILPQHQSAEMGDVGELWVSGLLGGVPSTMLDG